MPESFGPSGPRTPAPLIKTHLLKLTQRIAGMPERYEDNLIYCTTCTEQPDSFYEVVAWLVNRVTPGGSHIETRL